MPETGFPVEDKALFVRRLNDALVECGAERYDYLRETPMEYVREGDREYVACGHRRACVTMDSLPAMMADVYRQLSL
ncbi:hypothetical protein N1614_04210 [Adlercreutzia muris]|uniref:hypothetical protein n=1 Tax=Adlercreutzia muris TaxID=1796610 RepID=UPI0021D5DE9C|nr:hypothetical protein [Adlercreutzia muris]MCU7584552.1 hypothetical protein [Adlercreutzia muris]